MAINDIVKSNPDMFDRRYESGIIRKDTCPSAVDTVNPNQGETHRWTNTFNGTRMPDWKQRIKSHRNAVTAMSGSKKLVSASSGRIEHIGSYLCYNTNPPIFKPTTEYTSGYMCNLYASWMSVDSYDSSVANEAAARFYNKASSALSPVKGGVILAELRETLHMLRHPLQGIRRLLKEHDARSSKLKKLGKRRHSSEATIRSALRESWLETVFGWLPFAHDLDDILTYLHDHKERLSTEYIYCKGEALKENVLVDQMLLQSTHVYQHILVKRRWECRQYGQVRIGVGSNADTKRDLGLVPSEFLPTLWEVIPYSFVADYFTNIGDVVNAFSFPSANLAWVGRTERSTRTSITTGKPEAGWTGNCGQVTGVSSTVRRTVPVNSGLPTFEWDPDLGLKRLLNIGALLDGIRSRHSR